MDELPATDEKPAAGRRRRVLLGSSFAVLLLLLALRFCTDPDERGHGTHEQLGLPACGAMSLVRLPCPLCGVTTALSLAAHGHWLEALRVQPAGFLLALSPVLLAGLALGASSGWPRCGRAIRGALALIFLTAWIYKVLATAQESGSDHSGGSIRVSVAGAETISSSISR